MLLMDGDELYWNTQKFKDLGYEGFTDDFLLTLMDLMLNTQKLVCCSDCKYYGCSHLRRDGGVDKRYNPDTCFVDGKGKKRDPNWFCADGERGEYETD